jgi:hypothetical protein
MSFTRLELESLCWMSESRKKRYRFTAPGYPPIIPVDVGMALPEESVSWVMLSVPCGMKQDSADNPPRNLPAPPESVISLR